MEYNPQDDAEHQRLADQVTAAMRRAYRFCEARQLLWTEYLDEDDVVSAVRYTFDPVQAEREVAHALGRALGLVEGGTEGEPCFTHRAGNVLYQFFADRTVTTLYDGSAPVLTLIHGDDDTPVVASVDIQRIRRWHLHSMDVTDEMRFAPSVRREFHNGQRLHRAEVYHALMQRAVENEERAVEEATTQLHAALSTLLDCDPELMAQLGEHFEAISRIAKRRGGTES